MIKIPKEFDPFKYDGCTKCIIGNLIQQMEPATYALLESTQEKGDIISDFWKRNFPWKSRKFEEEFMNATGSDLRQFMEEVLIDLGVDYENP